MTWLIDSIPYAADKGMPRAWNLGEKTHLKAYMASVFLSKRKYQHLFMGYLWKGVYYATFRSESIWSYCPKIEGWKGLLSQRRKKNQYLWFTSKDIRALGQVWNTLGICRAALFYEVSVWPCLFCISFLCYSFLSSI